MRFRFYNFELGYSNGSTLLQGWSNRVYGKPSRWSDAHQAQCVEVEVKDEKEYLAMAMDLKLAWHLPMRLWVPVPEFAKPLTGPVADFQAGYELGMDRRPLPDEASANTIAGYLAAPEEPEQINGAEQPDVKVIPSKEEQERGAGAATLGNIGVSGSMHPMILEESMAGPVIPEFGTPPTEEPKPVHVINPTTGEGTAMIYESNTGNSLTGVRIAADQPLAAMKFFALRKIAKTEGVDISACTGVPQIVAAIEEHRKPQPV